MSQELLDLYHPCQVARILKRSYQRVCQLMNDGLLSWVEHGGRRMVRKSSILERLEWQSLHPKNTALDGVPPSARKPKAGRKRRAAVLPDVVKPLEWPELDDLLRRLRG